MVQNDGTKPVSLPIVILYSTVCNWYSMKWIWVKGSSPNRDTPSSAVAAEEAAALCMICYYLYCGSLTNSTLLVKEVSQRIEEIKASNQSDIRLCCLTAFTLQNDDSIPMRSNKKTGAKSKKEVREKVVYFS